MNIKEQLQTSLVDITVSLFQVEGIKLEVQDNKTNFEGDYTIVVFPLVKVAPKRPEEVGLLLGNELIIKTAFLKSFTVLKGFLHVTINESYFLNQLDFLSHEFNNTVDNKSSLILQYSSPNTNTPSHIAIINKNL